MWQHATVWVNLCVSKLQLCCLTQQPRGCASGAAAPWVCEWSQPRGVGQWCDSSVGGRVVPQPRGWVSGAAAPWGGRVVPQLHRWTNLSVYIVQQPPQTYQSHQHCCLVGDWIEIDKIKPVRTCMIWMWNCILKLRLFAKGLLLIVGRCYAFMFLFS